MLLTDIDLTPTILNSPHRSDTIGTQRTHLVCPPYPPRAHR